MCRWMAYSGDPVLAEELLFRPAHSIIDQSLHAKLGIHHERRRLRHRVVRRIRNAGRVQEHPSRLERPDLREVASQIRTPLLFAHIRASTGTPVQRSNCHPFRHGRWLWMHNGSLAGFQEMKRDLMMAVDPSLFADIEGSTDTETLFFLALTFGLQDDPPGRSPARSASSKKSAKPRNRVPGAHDGGRQRRRIDLGVPLLQREEHGSLYFSTDVGQLRQLYPDLEILHKLGAETRLVVSEPLRDLPGAWNEVPESSWGVVRPGKDEIQPFQPIAATT